MRKRLLEILATLPGKRVLVLGDLMIDEYIWGGISRISPEAPVPVVEVQSQSFVLGGASNVANNMAGLGGEITLVGVLGHDLNGEKFKCTLAERGMRTDGLKVDDQRPTTVKTRVIAQNQQVLRIDREDKRLIGSELEDEIVAFVTKQLDKIDALILSDYAKGVISPSVAQRVIRAAKQAGKVVAVDPKGKDYSKYRGATILTPNQKETEEALGERLDTQDKILAGGEKLRHDFLLDHLLVTRGAAGMSLFYENKEVLHIPAVVSTVYDVTGAGDTVISVLTLALAAGASLPEATVLANYAAGVVVKKIGTSTVTADEIREMMREQAHGC